MIAKVKELEIPFITLDTDFRQYSGISLLVI